MNYQQISRLIILLIITLSANAFADLIGYWPLDGNAQDMSGNGLNGSLVGSVNFDTTDRDGQYGYAARFTNSGAHIKIENCSILNVQCFTISAWVQWDSTIENTLENFGGIFNNTDPSYSDDRYALVAGADRIRSFINYPVDQGQDYGTFELLDGDFHHVAATYDGESRSLWLDGVCVDTVPFSDSIDYSASTETICCIGINFPGGDDWFAGAIDEVRLYNTGLSQTEIEALADIPELSSFLLTICGSWIICRRRKN